jgi:hypothetical protein
MRFRSTFAVVLLAFGALSVFVMQHMWWSALPDPTPSFEHVKRSAFDGSTRNECGATTAIGDALVHSYFASWPLNGSLLAQAERTFASLAAAHPAEVSVPLRQALVALLRLDQAKCLSAIDRVLALDPFHERAHLIRAYCVELGGDFAQSRNAHERARAMDVHGHDRYYAMPGGYNPYVPSDFRSYHEVFMPALAGSFVFTEFVEMGLGGRDRWISHLMAMQDVRVSSLDQVVSFFADNEYLILRGLLSPFEQRIFHQYYDATLMFRLLPNHEPFVTSCVNERIGYFLNQRFRPLISAIAEHPLQVSYSYFVNYYGKPNNPGLKAHTDAVDNEVTMTVSVTRQPYLPAWIWPIYFVKTRKNPVTELGTWEAQPQPSSPDVVPAILSTGDALLFRGRAHPHFREPLDPHLNQSYGNVLSHFVKADYPIWIPRHVHNERYKNDKDLPITGHREFIR